MTETRRAAAWQGLDHMEMRTRKALGCFALLAYIASYTVIAASFGATLASLIPTWAQLVFYAVAGIVWIFPLKPLFAWMNRNRERRIAAASPGG